MKILSVDTATRACSVAVLDELAIISEYTVNHGDTHSKFVMSMVHDILDVCSLAVTDIDGFAVTVGPGSFTGLRIGLSTMKGLAMATGKPLAGISTLEALAYQVSETGVLICPMLDARRKEVYTARYRFRDNLLDCIDSPIAIRPKDAVGNIKERCMFVGDGAVSYQAVIQQEVGDLAVFADMTRHTIRASTVGLLGMQRITAGDGDDVSRIQPVYLRKSDAEKNLSSSGT